MDLVATRISTEDLSVAGWMDSCNGSRSVQDISDSEKVVSNRTHAPWPVADRDAVLHNIARFDAAAERVELDFWSRVRSAHEGALLAVSVLVAAFMGGARV